MLPQLGATIDTVKTGADVVSYSTKGKSLTDRFLSYATDKDCKLYNLFIYGLICEEKKLDTEIATSPHNYTLD